MKRFMFLLTLLALSGVSATAGTTFDFVVEPSGTNLTFIFVVDGAQNFTIDWGDGNTNTAVTAGLQSHTYAVAGTYTNRVSGTATRIAFGGTGKTPLLLRDIVSPLSPAVTGINSAEEMLSGVANIMEFTQADWFDAASTNVTTMRYMFANATAFNQSISGWNVSKVTSMYGTFMRNAAFNQDIGGWNVAKVSTMQYMFFGASAFDRDIGGWSVSNVTSMHAMFNGASRFDQDISDWNVSKVIDMFSMFNGTSFNQDIGNWKVGAVRNMASMFESTSKFNQDIGGWDVSKVTDMNRMFHYAKSFNQDIGGWDVSKVTNMRWMFYYAYAFEQDISRWNVSAVKDVLSFLGGCTLPTDAYNQLLIRWSRLSLQPDLVFSGGGSKYDEGLPAECRARLKTNFNWTITDGNSTGNPYQMPATVLSIR